MLLLCSLREDDYDTFVLTMINGRTTISYKEVTSTLVNYKLRKSDGEPSEKASGDALTMRDRSPKPRPFNRTKSKPIGGHRNVACYVDSTEWILDSGAKYHICPRRDWFSSFEELERGDVVLMENDHVCPISGIGTVRIRMCDGVTRELKEVKFIPQLTKNIISLGTLETSGYKVIMENATLKVTKESMVVMRDVQKNNLYYLKGKTITEGLAAYITTEEDSTHL
ncbi:uncharacterized protein LOC109827417 [Asparagus officinalis]|uniref:uncharacterized protein LOC109827417 n=1 Tax=Asparagus officinalis TaxID=4686 RepID=UPI00098E13D3|nr:uncharacterized protein LOC109827417 [Asparagus officinalis]